LESDFNDSFDNYIISAADRFVFIRYYANFYNQIKCLSCDSAVLKVISLKGKQFASCDAGSISIWEGFKYFLRIAVIDYVYSICDMIALNDGRMVCSFFETGVYVYESVQFYKLKNKVSLGINGHWKLCEMRSGVLLCYDGTGDISSKLILIE
jgi:hypothetical protein